MKEVRIVLADDHTLVRAGIRGLLESLDGVTVCAETGDGHEALALIEQHRPDVALLDIGMAGLNGLDVAERVAKCSPQTRVIMLTMHSAESYVSTALRAGVAGYLLKEAAVAELPLALDAVCAGETYLSPAIAGHVVKGFIEKADPDSGPLDELTPRQREILQMIAEGNSAKDIAFVLGISPKTVDVHRAQLMDRLGIHDLAGLVRLAIRSGLVDPER